MENPKAMSDLIVIIEICTDTSVEATHFAVRCIYSDRRLDISRHIEDSRLTRNNL
jgi:hypothetical protein